MTCVPLDDATISYEHLMVLYLWMSISKIKTLKTSSRKKKKKSVAIVAFCRSGRNFPKLIGSNLDNNVFHFEVTYGAWFRWRHGLYGFRGLHIWNHIWHHFVKWWMKWWSNLRRLVTAVRGAGARALAWCGPGHLLPLAHKIEVKHLIITDVLQRYIFY